MNKYTLFIKIPYLAKLIRDAFLKNGLLNDFVDFLYSRTLFAGGRRVTAGAHFFRRLSLQSPSKFIMKTDNQVIAFLIQALNYDVASFAGLLGMQILGSRWPYSFMQHC